MPTFSASSEDTRVYELCVLYPYPLSQKDESALIKSIEALCEEHGGTQLAKDPWGRRGLAYTIGGYDEGCYIVYYYEFTPEAIKELDRNLRILPGVLRHMIVKPPKDYEVTMHSDAFQDWQKQKKEKEEEKKQEKEAKLKKRVLDKQKVQAKRAAAKKKDEKPAEKAEEGQITSEIDKLISDEDLDI